MGRGIKSDVETPLMKQYATIKAKYPGALLLFRVGDFYETFGQDAITTSRILGIVLTRRANGKAAFVELAGFPHHSLETYLPKLVKAGQRVAICDQLEDPKKAKTIVKRGVTELVTPGVAFNDQVLDHKKNNFLCAMHYGEESHGIAFLDVSTGEFYATEGSSGYVDKLLQSFQPSEVILQRNKVKKFLDDFGNFYTNTFDEWVFTQEFAYDTLLRHFGTTSLKGFGVEGLPSGITAAGAAIHYLAETHHDKCEHITGLSRIEEDYYVWLDRFTIRNLELVSSQHEHAVTLVDILDQTVSPMGSRMLRRWVVLPLKDEQHIKERHDIVAHITENSALEELIYQQLKQCGDLERIISKVATGRVSPREVAQLRRSMLAVAPVKEACTTSDVAALVRIGEQINLCESMTELIGTHLTEDPPPVVSKGGTIRSGVSPELDEYRALSTSAKEYLKGVQEREIINTGITSLKVGFNNVFGYFLEVTNPHKHKVPQEWTRKQTLTGSERYITEELKEFETKILSAEEKIQTIEQQLYEELVLSLANYIAPVQLNAGLLARIDCLRSFAVNAIKYNYVRPEINNGYRLDIIDGRHPVIEREMAEGEKYIPNDVYLDQEKQQIVILTGPNMSGKSALLRQTALITLMAQIGSFVPAKEAKIGLVDKIFTRVGASDNISSGESTFMVEMNETASILNNISPRSLIILDEIGRGTATYDGISIAWAIAEFLHDHPRCKPRVLFATHYHELNELAKSKNRIKNYHVTVKEMNNKVIFLRKLAAGGSEHSFGIHVARMAGMPRSTVDRANVILKQLEASHAGEQISQSDDGAPPVTPKNPQQQYQLSFIQLDDPLLDQIKADILQTDIDRLTPVEALMKLNQIKQLLGGK
jgi:DNA mismatch repair protein MutS